MGVPVYEDPVFDGTPYAVKAARTVWTLAKSERIARDEGGYIIDLSDLVASELTGDYTDVDIFDIQNENYEYALSNASDIGESDDGIIRIFCGNDIMEDLDGAIDTITASLLSDNQILIEGKVFAGEMIDSELFFIVVSNDNEEITRVLLRLYNELGSTTIQFENLGFMDR
jgi:hypothetical protein